MKHIALYFVLTGLFHSEARSQAGAVITLKDNSGVAYPAFAAGPEDAKAAVIFVHDYFGLSPAAKDAIEKLASMGYRVVGVDLYKGKTANENATATTLMQSVDKNETRNILLAAIHYLDKPGRKLATVGFSAGCADAMKANLLAPELFFATVLVYGGGYDQIAKENLDKLASPVLAITGSLDKWPMEAAMSFLASHTDKQFNLFVQSGADHGYAQPLFNGGKNYNYEATRVTWLLIENFLKNKLN